MLMVRIELWPHGDESRKSVLGTAEIANTGTGTESSGTYRSRFSLKRPMPWKLAGVEGFPRKRLNAWDLLYRLLHEAVGDRNSPKQPSYPEQGAAYWKARALAAELQIEDANRLRAQLRASLWRDLPPAEELVALGLPREVRSEVPRRHAVPLAQDEPLISTDLDEEDDS